MQDVTYRLKVENDKAVEASKKFGESLVESKKQTAELSKESAQATNAIEQGFKAAGVDVGRFRQMLTTAQTTTKSLTASTTALRLALIAIPFIAIAAAVMAVFKAFSSTQEGSDRLNRFLEPLRASFQALWGIAQDLSIIIVDRLVGAFQTFMRQARAVASIMQALKNRDIEGLKAGASELRDSFVDAAQGVRNAFTDIVTRVSQLGGDVEEAIRVGRRLAELEKEIEQGRIDSTVPLARMRREFEEMRSIIADTSKTEEERLKAIEDARNLSNERLEIERGILDLEIEQLELRQSLNDTSREEELQLQQLIARREELSETALREQRRLIATEVQLREAIEERFARIQELEEQRQERVIELDQLEIDSGETATRARIRQTQERIVEERKAAEERLALIEAEKQARVAADAEMLGSAIAANLQRAQNVRQATSGVLRAIVTEIIANQFRNIITQVPFPANIILAPVASVAAGRIANSLIPGFQSGGLPRGGQQIVQVNERGQESILNATATQALGENAINAINQGDFSGFNSAVDRFAGASRNMVAKVDVVDLTRKINDQERINSERDIDVR